MSQRTYPHLRGVTLELVRHEGRQRTAYVLHCAVCGATDQVFQACRTDGLPAEALTSLFSRKGWRVHSRGKHVCAACIAKEGKNVAKPREMSQKDGLQIIKALLGVYDEVNGRYCDGSTDQTVAQGLGVPRAWVEQIRERDFGPSGKNVEMDRIASELGTLAAAAKKLVDDGMALAAEGERLGVALEAERKRIDGVVMAVGPRAVRA